MVNKDSRGEQRLALKRRHIDGIRSMDMGWSDIVRAGVVEFIDVNEEETCMIAM